MPRFVVQRRLGDQPPARLQESGITAHDIVCLKSYLSDDRQYLYSVYDGPDSESVCTAVERDGVRVDCILKVAVTEFLPIFYR